VDESASGAILAFTNYGEDAGLGRIDSYEYQWFRFDNRSQETEPLSGPARATGRAIPLPAERPEYVMARIRSLGAGADNEAWGKKVEVFLRTTGGLTVVGIDRESSE
jgi:hypothetical protein